MLSIEGEDGTINIELKFDLLQKIIKEKDPTSKILKMSKKTRFDFHNVDLVNEIRRVIIKRSVVILIN